MYINIYMYMCNTIVVPVYGHVASYIKTDMHGTR